MVADFERLRRLLAAIDTALELSKDNTWEVHLVRILTSARVEVERQLGGGK
jgi:hypothetical protein